MRKMDLDKAWNNVLRRTHRQDRIVKFVGCPFCTVRLRDVTETDFGNHIKTEHKTVWEERGTETEKSAYVRDLFKKASQQPTEKQYV